MQIDTRVTGKTTVLGVIGSPIEHSISPQLHNTLSMLLGIDAIYVPLKVDGNSLQEAVKGLKALNIAGFNVTIPHKKEIIKYIDECDGNALLMGAVNTVKNEGGRLCGYNTDAEGFSRSFKQSTGMEFKGKRITVLGAGGAAQAVIVKMALEGAESISIINRTLSKAHEIAKIVNDNTLGTARAYCWEDAACRHAFNSSEIIINMTSAGMYPEIGKSPLEPSMEFSIELSGGQVVYDAIYNPSKTKLLADAEEKGCKAVNGLGMLLYQGIYAYEIWMDMKIDEDIIRQIFDSFKNILCK